MLATYPLAVVVKLDAGVLYLFHQLRLLRLTLRHLCQDLELEFRISTKLARHGLRLTGSGLRLTGTG